MDELVRKIKSDQAEDGRWGGNSPWGAARWELGETALGVLALASAGLNTDDRAVSKGVRQLVETPSPSVYEAALKAMALETVDPKKYRDSIKRAADYLIRCQLNNGGWSYGEGQQRRGDNSNSQFAILGLRSAARSGVKVPDAVWQRAWKYFAAGQNKDGGWGYTHAGGNSYGSMTVAGAASLYICGVRLHTSKGKCGRYISDDRVEAGLSWLGKNFSIKENPGRRIWDFYYLYGLERAGVISARRYMGGNDWYLRGVQYLVRHPGAISNRSASEWPLLRRCFALLFLAKGNSPVLVHKAKWNGIWEPYRYDAKMLTEEFGHLLDQRLTWQIMPLDAPLDHISSAPILYISGRRKFGLNPKERKNLKAYIRGGGFVLVDDNEGDRRFDQSFRKFVTEHLPGERFQKLASNHPVYTYHYKLPADQRPPLEAVRGPCSMSVLYIPGGVTCSWDLGRTSSPDFKLGINILAYATGMKKLKGKMSQWEEPVRTPPQQHEAGELKGAFVLGQLVHQGNWKPHEKVWPFILTKANKEAGVGLFSEPVALNPEEDSLFQAHFLNIIGTKDPNLSEATRKKIRRYVERGGFVFAEAACGSAKFDRAFRQLMKDIFPQQELQRLPEGHPLWKLGRKLEKVNYSPVVERKNPALESPYLEYIELEGRLVVVYSRYDLSSAVAGHPCFTCPSVLAPSASELMLKVVLFALTG
ncbi:MAG: DUF4159 domain-containing protein [Planctomycetes bacterium]|nr:DUF4159 domain-containing protein [Planctomycetota bacterium]